MEREDKKQTIKVTKKDREEATKSFIKVVKSIKDETLKKHTVQFFESVGLGKEARNTSET